MGVRDDDHRVAPIAAASLILCHLLLLAPGVHVRALLAAREPSDLEELFKSSLDLDMQLWKGKALSMAHDFHKMREQFNAGKLGDKHKVKVMLMYKNKVYFPDNKGKDPHLCEEPCHPYILVTVQKLGEAMAQGLRLPDAMFFLNTGDDSFCHPHYWPVGNPCIVPMLANYKVAVQQGRYEDNTDILVPQFQYMSSSMHDHPWDKKQPSAIFRGTPHCSSQGFNNTCSRVYLSYACRFHNVSKAVQIGLVTDFDFRSQPEVAEHGRYTKLPRVSLSGHAHFRWVVSLEGVSASTRFGLLMHTNSVVLKQRSPKIEYFYRALEPGRHYLEFWIDSRDDIFDIVPRLNQEYEADCGRFHGIAREAQAFAQKYLGINTRSRYWRAALLEYRALLPDMDGYIAQVLQELTNKGSVVE